MSKSRRFVGEEEKSICNDYASFKSCYKLAKKYHTYPATIHRILKRNNVELEKPGGRRQLALDEDYFKTIDTEEKSYWLGFIAADGWVITNSRSKQFGLSLNKKDEQHLELFRCHISFEGKIKKKKEQRRICFSSKKFVGNLVNKNIMQNKTVHMNWISDVPDNLMNHFIRGYFDGDGSWSVFDPGKGKILPQLKKRVMFEMIGTDKFTETAQSILIKELGLSKTKRPFTGINKVAKVLRYCGNGNSKKIYEWIYRDSTIWMARKRTKVRYFLE